MKENLIITVAGFSALMRDWYREAMHEKQIA